MVEYKTDKYTVRIISGEKYRAECIEIPEDVALRFARAILREDPHFFDRKKQSREEMAG